MINDCSWENLSFHDNNNTLKIPYYRTYLPLLNNNDIICDNKISSLLNKYILSQPRVPYGIKFSKLSFGRFVYYNTLMNYNFFDGKNNNIIAEIEIKNFKWYELYHNCLIYNRILKFKVISIIHNLSQIIIEL
jgi:hypothetical protein